MNNFESFVPVLRKALRKMDAWRLSFGDTNSVIEHDDAELEKVLKELQKRLEGNYPFHHPQYAGQMLKPPHPVAWLAYSLAMTINPNNHAFDGGPPTSEMEKETVNSLAEMAGYQNPFLGHLTSGGTIANLEALFVAREIHPGKKIAATSQAHYTHRRMCRVLNVPFLEIPVDENGSPDLDFLESHAKEIGTLVVTSGTTGLGRIEPLKQLIDLAEKHHFRIHTDAAYGGFFKIIFDSDDWNALSRSDSIVIDPHKHGLQPYGCGSVLFRDPSVGKFYKHDSPYTYFTSEDLHLGEISLECSRAGASAAAFWATLQLLPLTKEGIGRILQKTVDAASDFAAKIQESDLFELYETPQLDIVGYFPATGATDFSEISRASQKIFKSGMEDRENGFHLSLYKIPAHEFNARFPKYKNDSDSVTILRSTFMKPEHEAFIPELISRLHKLSKS